MGITANGYETTAIKEIEKDLQNLFLAALGADLSLDPETPQGQIISILTKPVAPDRRKAARRFLRAGCVPRPRITIRCYREGA